MRARRLVGALGVAAVVAATAAGTGSAADLAVTNANDSGPGSFRAAIAAASGNASIGRVVFSGVGTVNLAATVEYTGTQALEIVGNGAVLDGSLLGSDAAAFASQTTGNLAIRTLTVRDAPGEGVVYQVPAGSSEARAVTFDRVQILGNGGHGVLVNDQDFPEIVRPGQRDPAAPGGLRRLPAWCRSRSRRSPATGTRRTTATASVSTKAQRAISPSRSSTRGSRATAGTASSSTSEGRATPPSPSAARGSRGMARSTKTIWTTALTSTNGTTAMSS